MLALPKSLHDRVAALGRSGYWSLIVADLDLLTDKGSEPERERFVARSASRSAGIGTHHATRFNFTSGQMPASQQVAIAFSGVAAIQALIKLPL